MCQDVLPAATCRSSVYLDCSYEYDGELKGSPLLMGIMAAEVLASLVPVFAEKWLSEGIVID